jgi:hypothetical protein
MIDCSGELCAYHNEQVLLSSKQLDKLRAVRNANRRRVKDGLRQMEFRQPYLFSSQGSYAMQTVIWKEERDFDIDDGVYFDKDYLVGPRGAEFTPLQARELICNAVDDGSFSQRPEVRRHCVRIWYSEGYHVDMPVYRRVRTTGWWNGEETYFELASSKWKRADARAVTEWFDAQSRRYGADNLHGGQLRRIVRLLKDFANSRPSWRAQTATGFMITALTVKSFKPNPGRDDICLRDTMAAMAYSLFWFSYSILHPVLQNETITKTGQDGRPRFFIQQVRDAVKLLDGLSRVRDHQSALKVWDRVFHTDYFTANARSECTLA